MYVTNAKNSEGLSGADKMLMNSTKIDEGVVSLADINIRLTIARIKRDIDVPLSDDEIKELNEGIVINNDRVDLNLSELSGPKKELAISLGRSFDTLSDEAVDELLNIISKE